MLRILLGHYSVPEYDLFKTDLHRISGELSVSHIETGDIFNLLRYFVPDVLFIDLSIEDKASVRSLQKLRSEPRFNALPTVIYSHPADWKYVREYYFSTANHYMAKPYSFSNLCNAFEAAFTSDMGSMQFPFKRNEVNSYITE